MFRPSFSIGAERRLLAQMASPEGAPRPEVAPGGPGSLVGRSRAELGRCLRATAGDPDRRAAVQAEIDRRRANDAILNTSVVTPPAPQPQPVPLPGPDLPPGTILPGNPGPGGTPRPRTGPFTSAVPFNPGSLPFRPGTTSTPTPRVEPTPGPRPRVTPRGPGGAPEALGPTRRLTYGTEAQNFIATRLSYVTNTLDNPASELRRFSMIMTDRTSAPLDASIGTSDGIKLEKSGRDYNLEWTDGTTVRKFKVREFMQSVGRGQMGTVFVGDPDPLMQAGAPNNDVFPGGRMDRAFVKILLRRAVTRRASESADAARMMSFDLPRGEPILYTGVYEQILPTEENHARHFGSFLGQANGGAYNVVGAGNDTFHATTDLLARLEARFDGALAQGIKNHYLYFSVHGNANRISFKTPGGGQIFLEPRDLMALFTLPKFRECRFTLRMNCCNGGGFRSGEMASLFRAPGEEGRISVFIQAKPELPNPIRTTDADDLLPDGTSSRNFDTPYDYYLVHFLNSGMSYGQAHLAADRATKTNFPGLDAGVFRSGVLDGSETADPRNPLRPDRMPERLDGLGSDERYT